MRLGWAREAASRARLGLGFGVYLDAGVLLASAVACGVWDVVCGVCGVWCGVWGVGCGMWVLGRDVCVCEDKSRVLMFPDQGCFRGKKEHIVRC